MASTCFHFKGFDDTFDCLLNVLEKNLIGFIQYIVSSYDKSLKLSYFLFKDGDNMDISINNNSFN